MSSSPIRDLKTEGDEMQTVNPRGKCLLAGVVAIAALAFFGTAHAGITVLYSFTGGKNGAHPDAGLIEDKAGNLYGTTGDAASRGTAFKIAPDGTETVLHVFTGRHGDGAYPYGDLTKDKIGNLRGTTAYGGTHNFGTIFKLAPDGTETILYAFRGPEYGDGAYPYSGLIQDKAGNVYGTTSEGGAYDHGAIFKLAPDGTETVLYSFAGGRDGAQPLAGLLQDKTGNLYGTTSMGGGSGCKHELESGCGTVFRLSPDDNETVLYAFDGDKDGTYPQADLIQDEVGNLYGTTALGGTGCDVKYGCGTVFKLAADGSKTVLHAFAAGNDGTYPLAGLILDKSGILYGTTSQGGGTGCQREFESGCGIIFKLAPNGAETVLYAFSNKTHGIVPRTGLLKGDGGRLYGTASEGGIGCGGFGCGTVFRLRK